MSAALKTDRRPLHTVEGTLHPKAPFDFAQSLAFVRLFRPCAGEQVFDQSSLTKALRVRGQTIVFRVEGAGTVEAPLLRYVLHSDVPISAEVQDEAARRIGDFFSIDDDLHDFYARAEKDPVFSAHAKAQYGHHHVRFLTPIEIAVWAVLGQRSPVAVARKVKDALVEKYGTALEVDGVTYRAFPDVEALSKVTPAEWLALTKNERKARYAQAVVKAFATTLDERALREDDYVVAKERLMAIDGIGDWSSAFILFRGLGRVDHCPVTEPILKAAQAAYGPKTTKADAEKVLAAYGPLKGYWALYLRADDAAASQGLRRRRA